MEGKWKERHHSIAYKLVISCLYLSFLRKKCLKIMLTIIVKMSIRSPTLQHFKRSKKKKKNIQQWNQEAVEIRLHYFSLRNTHFILSFKETHVLSAESLMDTCWRLTQLRWKTQLRTWNDTIMTKTSPHISTTWPSECI